MKIKQSAVSGWSIQNIIKNRLNDVCYVKVKVFCRNKNMFEPQNLPFQLQNYLREPQHLEQLRTNLNSIMHQDLNTLESLLSSVEATLNCQQSSDDGSPMSDVRRKQKEGQLFLLMAEQNRQRSEKIASLVQLMNHLLDFIEEEQHNYEQMQQDNQRTIDRLISTIEQLRFSNKNVKSDVEVFREQLEKARLEIDELVQQQAEEQEEQEGLIREGFDFKESRIAELEGELEELKNKVRSSRLGNMGESWEKKDKSLRFVYSESQFFPINVLQNQYTRLTRQLECEQEPSQLQNQQHIQSVDKNQQNHDEKLSKALQHVLSRKSITSELHRDSSGLLRFDTGQSNFNMNKLCLQLRNAEEDFDILPRMPSIHTPKKLIYLDDEEEGLHRDYSRNIFDRLCQKQNQTMPTPKNSDHRTSSSYQSCVTLTPRCETAPKWSEFRQQPKTTQKYQISLKKKESLKQTSQGKGFYSTMFNFVVNRRIKRASQKATSYSPIFKT